MYASLSRGFKAGGFNLAACGGNPFDEEILDALEFGYKSLFLDGQLTLFSAVYYYDYTDMQVRSFTPDLSVEFRNAAESEIYGVESEFVFQPSVNWRLDGGVNLQKAEYKKGLLDDSMIAGINEVDISGNQLLRAPDLKANIGIQYTHWLGSGASLEARYDASYSDDYYVDAHENSFAQIESRTLQNFRVTWTNATGTTFVQLFGNNLADEEHLEWLLNAPGAGGTVGMWGAPRTFGLRFGFNTL
jgi:iron complex outermembrane receptor protein